MTGREAIKAALEGTQGNLKWYVSDFSDADLLVRPVPGANHAAWQIGNVIGGDIYLIRAELPDAAYPELPPGFMDQHGSKGANDDAAEKFLTKAEYLKTASLEKIAAENLRREEDLYAQKIAAMRAVSQSLLFRAPSSCRRSRKHAQPRRDADARHLARGGHKDVDQS